MRQPPLTTALALALLASACREAPPSPPARPPPEVAPPRPEATPARPGPDPGAASADVPVVRPVAVRDAGRAPAPTTPIAPIARGRGFLGLDDEAILSRICNAPVERIQRNRGGSTISFRVWFADGQRALFKPQQRSEVANYRAELAAYRMSRALGLGRVPPACGRTLPRALLQRTADGSGDAAFSTRVMTELLARGDDVPGAMIYWVPGRLENVPGTEDYAALLDLARPLPPERTSLAAELSTLLLFDYINDNVDRWSGGNILRQRAEPGSQGPGAMLFMDNGAAFSALHDGLGARPSDQATRLERVQRFSPSLVRALRGLGEESLRRAVSEDPLGPCLSDLQIRAVLTRRDRVLAHVAEITAAHSEGDALVFP